MQYCSFDEPGEVRVKILNNVWCVGRAESKEIGSVSGKKEKGMETALRGVCTRCGGPACPVKSNSHLTGVARAIENE